MSQVTRLTALAAAMGTDVKNLTAKIGDLTALTTGQKTSLVLALNEVNAAVQAAASQTELDATQAGAGLTVAGAYIKDATTNYIALATSLANADKVLDSTIKTLADRVAQIEGGGTGVVIDDTAGLGVLDKTWSANKSTTAIADASAALKADILGGAGAAYDTLKELQDLLEDSADAVVALTTAVNNRVSYADVQTLSTPQKLQACQNIGIGDPETDLVAAYTAAKA